MYILHPSQQAISDDSHRFQVINCGRRFGKSTLAALEMVGKAYGTEDARVPYYAPTRDDARDIMWRILKEVARPVVIGDPNESRLELNIRNQFGGHSLIALYGWESVQERGKGVGVKNNYVVFDEVAKYKNFWYGWQEILRPTLLDLKGGAMFVSTPNGYNHFYDLSLLEGVDLDYKYFHFTSYDNPHLPMEEINKMKTEMTEDRFAQEVIGEFRKKEGLVYKEFMRDQHVVDIFPDLVVESLGGVDFGYTNPAAIITVKKDYNGVYWVTNEWYKTGKTEDEVVDMTVQLSFNKVFPDPENASAIKVMKRRGVNVREVNKGKGSIISGISKVRELLKQNRLKIQRSCINTIQEFEMYSYPEGREKMNQDELPEPEYNHAMDAIRYVLSAEQQEILRSTAPRITYGSPPRFGRQPVNIRRL